MNFQPPEDDRDDECRREAAAEAHWEKQLINAYAEGRKDEREELGAMLAEEATTLRREGNGCNDGRYDWMAAGVEAVADTLRGIDSATGQPVRPEVMASALAALTPQAPAEGDEDAVWAELDALHKVQPEAAQKEALQTMADEAQALGLGYEAAELAPEAAEPVPAPVQPTGHHLVDPTERSDQSVQRAAGGGAVQPVAETLSERLQRRCVEMKTYWRASDAHGVDLTIEQATDLLRDALGVEVEIATPPVESVETAIQSLCRALAESKGWLTGYADAIIRDAIDRRGGESVERDALRKVRECLEVANTTKGGPICDTIWFGPGETLVDFIDAALAGHKEQQP